MNPPTPRHALILGRDPSGDAAAALLRRTGVQVVLVDAAESTALPAAMPDLVVLSAAVGPMPDLARQLAARGVPVIGERELAFRHCLCLHVAVTGASGKRTTVELIAHLLRTAGRRVGLAAGPEQPASALAEVSRELDFLVHAVSPAELEHLDFFRPVVGVLLNVSADLPEAEEARDGWMRRWSRLFARQQPFDWAIVQSEALAQLQSVGAVLPGKLVTFSASSRQADLGLERGLLVSRLAGWTGPLWDMARGRMIGPHFAEDALAALSVGRVLRMNLEEMTPALEDFRPPAGRMELLGEIDGVRFVHDGCASNLDALAKALLALAPTPPENPFIHLIAGGRAGGRQFYDLGPVLSPRVKQAYVFGDASDAMRAAWQLFTPCSPMASLLDAARRAVEQASPGDVVLFSPACPGSEGGWPSHPGTDVYREIFEARRRDAPRAVATEIGSSPVPALADGVATSAASIESPIQPRIPNRP